MSVELLERTEAVYQAAARDAVSLPLAELALSLETQGYTPRNPEYPVEGFVMGLPYSRVTDLWLDSEGREIRDQEVVRIDYTELIQRIESEIEKSFTDPAMVQHYFDLAFVHSLARLTEELHLEGAPHRLQLLTSSRPYTSWFPGFVAGQARRVESESYLPGIPGTGEPWQIVFRDIDNQAAYLPMANPEDYEWWARHSN